MKIKLVFFTVLLTVFMAATAFAQSVVVTPKKVTYRRPKPQMDFKKSFVITYPVVKAATPALSKKIEAALNYEKLFGFTIAEAKTENQWLEEANYEVFYNANNVMSVGLSTWGTAAYPDGSTHYVNIDTKTGAVVSPAMAFTNIAGLVAQIKKLQDAEVKAAKIEIKKNPDGGDVDQLFENTNFTAENLDSFKMDAKGITFVYDYGFPHVIQAFEPNGWYFLSWTQMKAFVKPLGPFSKLGR